MNKSWGCHDIYNSLYLAPDELRNCCQRFFVKGKMKGDVVVYKVNSQEDIDPKKILDAKLDLIEQINSNQENACSGCPSLKFDYWPTPDKLKIKHLSIESSSVCNMRCTYCSDMYYGGKKANYDLVETYNSLRDAAIFDNSLSVVWGGGEPMLLKDFSIALDKITNEMKPFFNNVFTNSIIYSEKIAELLSLGKVTITTSIDAGYPENFFKIRASNKMEQVLSNLRRYYEQGKERVTIKYILMPENSSFDEISSFVDYINKYSLSGCTFQISTDYKNEEILNDMLESAIHMYKELKKIGSVFVNFDDHLRPRMSEKLLTERGEESTYENVIIWGTGRYAEDMIRKTNFLSKNTVNCFIDSAEDKIGKTLDGFEIKSPDYILQNNFPIFIASANFYREIYNKIIDMGVSKNRIMDHFGF